MKKLLVILTTLLIVNITFAQDDVAFFEPFDNNANNWTISDTDDASSKIQNGFFVIRNKKKDYTYRFWRQIPIQESRQLKLIEEDTEIYPGIELKLFYGHTLGQILPHIKYNNKTLVYCGDLLPTSAHIPIPYVMSYDMFPLQTIDEKEVFLNEALKNDYIIFFEHDIFHECCNLELTERGIKPKGFFKLEEIFSY